MENAKRKPTFKDNHIREVNVSYRKTDEERCQLGKGQQVADYVRSVLIDNSREHFVVLYLDGAHQVASYSIVSIGTANLALVTAREVFQRAILVGSIAIILAHNHPSGKSTPSDEDRAITKRLIDAGHGSTLEAGCRD